MSDREATIRTAVITYFPMFIAALSLITSIFNGYLNNRLVNFSQRSLSRTEYLHTCKDIIDTYFQIKFRAGVISEGDASPAAQLEAANAVNKFAALGTYLANLRDDPTREQYTHLSWELEKIVREAGKMPLADFSRRFEPADKLFAEMNNDCIKTANQ
jgi:hypothetical protein